MWGLRIHNFGEAISNTSLEMLLTAILLIALFFFPRVVSIFSPSANQVETDEDTNSVPQEQPKYNWLQKLALGVDKAMIEIVVTTAIIGFVLLVFQEASSIRSHQAQLVLQMGSPYNNVASEAVRQLTVQNWLDNGTLRDADLRGANLTGIDLNSADLYRANLFQAILIGAALPNVSLTQVELTGADFTQADLGGANLQNARLLDARLSDAYLNNRTILPDGNLYSTEIDLSRFTNPSHPNYWNPCTEAIQMPWYCN